IPATATCAMAGHFDFAKLVTEARTAAGKIEPQAQAMMDKGLGGAQMMLGVNLQKDFFESLGDQWAAYVDPTTGGRGPLGVTVVNRLAKPAEAQRCFAKLELAAYNLINGQLQHEGIQIGFETVKIGASTIHYVATPLASPSWAVSDGNLYLGL